MSTVCHSIAMCILVFSSGIGSALIAQITPIRIGKSAALIAQAKRVLFLGDSITHAGGYIVGVEAAFQTLPNPPEFINLGLPSETCSGLSELAHPFPRPNVLDRIDDALNAIKPDVVIVCYGMNDAIYHPLDEARFQKYKAGVSALIEKCKAANARVILLTPPPFDPLPLSKLGKLRPEGADEFSWETPYQNYNSVMLEYSQWILSQRDQVVDVIDLFHPLLTYVAVQRASDPDFALSLDGVHVDERGHDLIAKTILDHLRIASDKPDAELLKLVSKRQTVWRDAWLTKVGHQRPGVKAGLPIAEATTKTAVLTSKIKAWSVKKRNAKSAAQ